MRLALRDIVALRQGVAPLGQAPSNANCPSVEFFLHVTLKHRDHVKM